MRGRVFAVSLLALTILGPPAAAGNDEPPRSEIIEVPAPPGARCGSRCAMADYRRFIERHRQHAVPISHEELDAELEALFRAPPAQLQGLDAEQLAREIPERLNIAFLLDGLGERQIEVAVLREERTPSFVRRDLLFIDPEVGSFRGLVVIPEGTGPFPAVLGLHGHRGSDHGFYDYRLGRELTARGFVVALTDFRLFGCGRQESRVTRELLRNGFHLLGLRVYEAMLMTQYLRSLEEVDRQRVAVIGHSGGSSVARLLVRIKPWFRAAVVDHAVDFRDRCNPFSRIHCETVPSLFPIGPDIRDLSTLGIPYLKVTYGFRKWQLREAILDFFDAQLRAPRAALELPDVRPSSDAEADARTFLEK